MCNAYSQRHSRDEVRQWLAYHLGLGEDDDLPADDWPRYRIGPRQNAAIVTAGGVRVANWGLIPPGAKERRPKQLMTNARDDKVAAGWPWKLVVRRGRCLVLADGFYEPEKTACDKRPAPWSFYQVQGGGLFGMAGLFSEPFDATTGEILATYTVITTAANDAIRIHDRMPVILDPEEARAWLTADDPPLDVLRPYPADRMTGHRVGDAAKNSRSPDGPDLVAPVTALL